MDDTTKNSFDSTTTYLPRIMRRASPAVHPEEFCRLIP
jgi:hypothetical protein